MLACVHSTVLIVTNLLPVLPALVPLSLMADGWRCVACYDYASFLSSRLRLFLMDCLLATVNGQKRKRMPSEHPRFHSVTARQPAMVLHPLHLW